VRWRVVSEGWRREGPPLRTTGFVVSLDDGDADELTSGDGDVGWELVVYSIDVVCVAKLQAGGRFRGNRRVCLQIVRPCPHGLEGAAHGVRDRTRVSYAGTRESGFFLANETET